MNIDQAFDQIFAPARPAERQILGGLIMSSYCAQRDYGMPADKAASLLGVDADIAEKLYRESKT